MFRMARRGCTASCLGCLLPVLVAVGLVVFCLRQMTTPPSYPQVLPASPAAVHLAVSQALHRALSLQQPVVLVSLDDAEATYLLREGLAGYAGLSNLQVHVLSGSVVVSGGTALLSHPLVISGPVGLTSGGGSVIAITFRGLWVGQLGLPAPAPQLLTKTMHPTFTWPVQASGETYTLACYAAHQNDLVVGFQSPAAGPKAAQACAGAG
ncbi:MAG TPA: hypothetical protein VMV23_12235 [Candidatus Nanopelagicaceae bacterium]|nr:hypothetical protein [Candidatus Nanopelagicaceae bacterium]